VMPKTHLLSFDEKDWNPVSIPACEKLGRGATGVDKYRGRFQTSTPLPLNQSTHSSPHSNGGPLPQATGDAADLA
jgi:hypothetical protein